MVAKRGKRRPARKRKSTKKAARKRPTRVTSRPRSRARQTRPPWVVPLWIAVALAVFAAGYYLGGGAIDWLPQETPSGFNPADSKAQQESSSSAPSADNLAQKPAAEYPVPEVAADEPPAHPESMRPAFGVARIALVIDDLGRKVSDVQSIEALGVPVTYAVLPFEIRTRQVVEAIRAGGHEMICHLPMEPANGANPGPGALTAAMGSAELAAATERALDAVPGLIGVNNHMGSSLTTNTASMTAILEVVRDRGLYFLDSRTSATSAGYRVAKRVGIPTAERQVFLDGELTSEWIGGQFLRAMEIARKDGAAVVIGHPHPVTMEALQEWVPRAEQAGYQFVLVSNVLERSGGPVG